ncbi:hypothetical protein DMB95_06050 [Campylobacter sp. MIT 12-8780]|nr:DUF5684 domain-containing protein [Campylobacter sp. MIT 19-121]TQR41047.1 hypothetical protein DMB95_06050 [Campylobacter sp. MIT 12-8780]
MGDIGALVVIVGIFCVIFLPFYLIFKKANVNAWAAFVPFYNFYMLGKVAKDEALGALLVVVIVIGFILSAVAGEESALGGIATIAIYICYCFVYVNLGRRFEVSLGFKIALCIPFISWIMLWILALDKSYVYKKESLEETSENQNNIQ